MDIAESSLPCKHMDGGLLNIRTVRDIYGSCTFKSALFDICCAVCSADLSLGTSLLVRTGSYSKAVKL